MESNYLYLAHPFISHEYIRKWELRMEKKLGIELYNPFYDTKEVRKEIKEDAIGGGQRYTGNAVEIVRRDLKAIKNSAGVVVILDGNERYGTIMEIVYACLFVKPVYIIVTTGHSQHYWIQYHAQKVFTTLKQFEKWLKKELE